MELREAKEACLGGRGHDDDGLRLAGLCLSVLSLDSLTMRLMTCLVFPEMVQYRESASALSLITATIFMAASDCNSRRYVIS